MSTKKINELETYDITKATENDVLPVVETKDDANETKKLPVSDLRDIMAKWSVANGAAAFAAMLVSFKNGTGEELAANLNKIMNAVKDFSGEDGLSMEGFRAMFIDAVPTLDIDIVKMILSSFHTDMDFDGKTDAELRTALVADINEDKNFDDFESPLQAFVGFALFKLAKAMDLDDGRVNDLEFEDCEVIHADLTEYLNGNALEQDVTIEAAHQLPEGAFVLSSSFRIYSNTMNPDLVITGEGGKYKMDEGNGICTWGPEIIIEKNQNSSVLNGQPVTDEINGGSPNHVYGFKLLADGTTWNESVRGLKMILKRRYRLDKKVIF